MLNDPVQRAVFAKRNVVESAVDDEDNPRVQWREKLVGRRADLRFPLSDVRMVERQLRIAAQGLLDIAASIGKLDRTDQSRLYLAGERIRALNGKLNAKRWSDDA